MQNETALFGRSREPEFDEEIQMAPDINCSRCGETRPETTTRIPFRSPLREEVHARICGQCWDEWEQQQIKVINELALNLGDPRSHDLIELNARQFLNLEEGD